MGAGLNGTTLRQYLSGVTGTNAQWEFQLESQNVAPEDDLGVGMGALLIELLRAIFLPA